MIQQERYENMQRRTPKKKGKQSVEQGVEALATDFEECHMECPLLFPSLVKTIH